MTKGFDSNPNLYLNFKKLSTKCLGENVYHLLLCLYVLQPNGSPLNSISQEVVFDVYVFSLVMEHWILRYPDATLIVMVNYYSL